MKRKVISIILILILLQSYIYTVIATSTSELNGQKADIQGKINDARNEQAGVQEELDEEMKVISNLDYEIAQGEEEISKLENQIKEVETSIEAKEKLIKEKQKEYDENEELLQQRLVVMYEMGETSFLDMLFNSSNVIDFISNYYTMSQFVEYDTELLQTIENDKKQIEEAKQTLVEEKLKIETLKSDKVSKTNSIKAKRAQRQEKANSLSEEKKKLQKEIDSYNAQIKKVEDQIAKILAQANSQAGSSGLKFDGSFIWPCNNKIVTSTVKKRWGRWHKGIDIGASHENVYAAASGYAYNLENPGGYGHYIMIVHGSGYITLYAHLLSRKVSDGQYVKQGQTIATSGGGLTDEGRGSSTGRHLHFEIRKASSISNYFSSNFLNPLEYLPGGYTLAAGATTPS
ncbi:MAG: peptidoglycan DD-metalloendopeptidase family protein [Clostridia bacterium]|nr:peptidoglycan DD-metalloendopeptidase family protein [Clostridia bacterium]